MKTIIALIVILSLALAGSKRPVGGVSTLNLVVTRKIVATRTIDFNPAEEQVKKSIKALRNSKLVALYRGAREAIKKVGLARTHFAIKILKMTFELYI